jgi:hypothetical protein
VALDVLHVQRRDVGEAEASREHRERREIGGAQRSETEEPQWQQGIARPALVDDEAGEQGERYPPGCRERADRHRAPGELGDHEHQEQQAARAHDRARDVVGEHVGVRHPLQCGRGESQVVLDAGQRDLRDRQVQRVEQDGRRDHRKRET